jgi:hypothetical protein
MGSSAIHDGYLGMLKAVSFERAELLLARCVSDGWISDWTPDQMYELAGSIRKHARVFLELRQVDPVKAAIQRTEITPLGKVFIPEHDL